MDELDKLLENAGIPVQEDDDPIAQKNADERYGPVEKDEPDEELLSMFEAELDHLLSSAEADINRIVDEYDMHKAFKTSLKHQCKKLAEQKLFEWTKAPTEWLRPLD